MKISKTSTIAWNPNEPMLALGTVSGALDDSFSSKTSLELYRITKQGLSLEKSIDCKTRFNELTWNGFIAGAKEDGIVEVYDSDLKSLFSKQIHSKSVKSLELNNSNLLASVSDELVLTNLENFQSDTLFKHADLSCVRWNVQVNNRILATCAGSDCIVFDLKENRKVIQLHSYKGLISCLAWQPNVPMQLVTSTEQAVLVWDLRNAHAPLYELPVGGVLSLDWSQKDADLLLTGGKDNQVYLWNVTTAELLGNVSAYNNWVFNVKWSPRNPEFFASASFDGIVHVQSILEPSETYVPTHVPKWLKRNVGCSFGFGGKLVKFGEGNVVQVRDVMTEPLLKERALELENALQAWQLVDFCMSRKEMSTTFEDQMYWNVLSILLSEQPRELLVDCLNSLKTKQVAGQDIQVVHLEGEQTNNAPAISNNADASQDQELAQLFGNASLNSQQTIDNAELFLSQIKSSEPFHLYPENADPMDNAITQSVLTGDFERAVLLCIQSNRLADALLVGMHGGAETLKLAQDAYLKREHRSYLRLIRNISENLIEDTVRSADLSDWHDILQMVCIYAAPEELQPLADILGHRLEEKWIASMHGVEELSEEEYEQYRLQNSNLRMNSLLCFIVAHNIEKVVAILCSKIYEDEEEMQDKFPLTNHVLSLESFAEKTSIYFQAIGMAALDPLLNLESLYEVYVDYAKSLVSQGLVKVAGKYVAGVPNGFEKYRILNAGGVQGEKPFDGSEEIQVARQHVQVAQANTNYSSGQNVGGYAQPQQPTQAGLDWLGENQSGYQNTYANQTGYVQQPNYANLPSSNMPSYCLPPQQQQHAQQPAPVYAHPAANYPATQNYTQPTQPFDSSQPAFLQPTQHSFQQPSTLVPQAHSEKTGPPPTAAMLRRPSQGWNDPPEVPLPNVKKAAAPVLLNTANVAKVSVPPPMRKNVGPPPMSKQGMNAPPNASIQPPPMAMNAQQIAAFNSLPVGQPPSQPSYNASPQTYPLQSAGPPTSYNAPPPQASYNAPPVAQPSFNTPPAAQPTYNTPPPQVLNAPPPTQAPYNSPSAGIPKQTQAYVAQSAGPPPMNNPPPSRTTYVPQQQSQQRNPPGDRSHIPRENLPIVQILSSRFSAFAASLPPQQKRTADEIQNRLAFLFDALNNNDIPPHVTTSLLNLCKSLENRDMQTAASLHLDIVTRFPETVAWMAAVKKLI